MNDPNDDTTQVRRQVWLILCAAVVLYGPLRLVFGPLPQDPAYHLLADTRTLLGVVPRAGDVISNLAILMAGLFGLALRPRMTDRAGGARRGERADRGLDPDCVRVRVLPLGARRTRRSSGTGCRSQSCSCPVLALVMADRVHPLFAREALWPFTALGIASVNPVGHVRGDGARRCSPVPHRPDRRRGSQSSSC